MRFSDDFITIIVDKVANLGKVNRWDLIRDTTQIPWMMIRVLNPLGLLAGASSLGEKKASWISL